MGQSETPCSPEGGYQTHSSLARPDKHATISRYMTRDKFLDLIESRALYFARADVMADSFEGRVPAEVSRHRAKTLWDEIELQKPAIERANRADGQSTVWFHDSADPIQAGLDDLHERKRSEIYLCCWHLSSRESERMWDEYAGTNGVMIQLPFAALEGALPERWAHAIYAGVVEYSNFPPSVPGGNVLLEFMNKWRRFEHELELRLIFDVHDSAPNPLGFRVPVDLDSLLAKVVLAPGTTTKAAAQIESELAVRGLAGRSRASVFA